MIEEGRANGKNPETSSKERTERYEENQSVTAFQKSNEENIQTKQYRTL